MKAIRYPKLPLSASIGELYQPAMKIKTQADADAYFERLVERSMADGQSRTEAEKIERSNLGYYAGYHDDATIARVERLFGCTSPAIVGYTHFVRRTRKGERNNGHQDNQTDSK